MMLVAIDTSGDTSGIALWGDHGLIAQTQWQSGRRHSEQVLVQIDALCRLCDVAPSIITHVAVSCGPGSWSGIRVGISIAKGLAIANDIPVIAVNALDVLAWPWRTSAPITAALALGRGRVAMAHYPIQSWHPGSIAAHNMTVSQLSVDCAGNAICCAPHLWTQLPDAATITHHAPFHATPALVAAVALQTPATTIPVAPIYLGEAVKLPHTD
jgi:tRNA threonylcarbamoyladenosine biosynthesis protein TsaB